SQRVALAVEHHVDGFRRQRVEKAGDGDLAKAGGAAVLGVTQYGDQFAGLLGQLHPCNLRRGEHQRQGGEVHVETVRRAAVVIVLVLAALGVFAARGQHLDVFKNVDDHFVRVVELFLHADVGGVEGAQQVDLVAGTEHAVEGIDLADFDRLDPLAQLDVFGKARHAVLLYRVPGDRPPLLQGLNGHAFFQARPVLGQHRVGGKV